jgi:hypothetical protein
MGPATVGWLPALRPKAFGRRAAGGRKGRPYTGYFQSRRDQKHEFKFWFSPADNRIKDEFPPATRNVPPHCDAETLAESVLNDRES